MNNLVVQLLLKTGTFSSDLKTARGQIQNFERGCSTAGKSLSSFGSAIGINVGGLAKFGGAVGAAALAGKEFKNIMDSSQTTADRLQGAIAGCKGVVESFRTSIASMDFSAFKNGLWDVFDAAKAVQDALDQLGNTQIAYDYKTKQNQTKFQEAYNVFKDPQSTAQMKEDAKKQMKEAVDAQFAYANSYSNSLYKTYVAQVVKKAGKSNLSANNVTIGQFEKAMNIDIGLGGDPEKLRQDNERQYQDYLRKLKEYGKNNITAQEDLKKQYRDVIAIHAMLELMKDDELKGVAQLVGGMEDAKQVALSMQRTMNRAMSGSGNTNPRSGRSSKTNVQKDEIKVEKESLTYWQNILTEETKYRDALVKDTEEWKLHNDKVIEAAEKIKEIRGEEEKRKKHVEGSLNYYNEMLNNLKEQRDALDPDTEEWDKVSKKIVIVESGIENIQKLTTYIGLDEALAVQPPTIASLQKVISILKQMRDNAPIGSEMFNGLEEDIKYFEKLLNLAIPKTPETGVENEDKKWQSFNQTMANCSTIANSLFNTFKEGSELSAASVLQMVATSLPAVGSLISAFAALAGVEATEKAVKTSKHWIEAIAAVAALGAVVATAIASAQSSTRMQRFASGGIVGGSSFTGDRVPAMVNSGEMILNKSQQARLFKIANGGGTEGNNVTFHISGTDLVGVLNNNNRKSKLIR